MDTVKARKHMLDSQVRPNDVTDHALQAAMGELPRERFVPADKRHLAYVERSVPLFDGRYLLQARDFAKMIDAANVQRSDLVLDVACGYGYSAAVLSRLASVVVGVEDDETVVAKASERLAEQGCDNAVMMHNPLTEGCAKQGPYDVIVLAGGVEDGLTNLLHQLKPDAGRLVTVMMNGRVGRATLFTRAGEAFGERTLFECYPPHVLPGFGKKATFTF
ncbi:MAG: protein-L-isoaspartate O-methyltransferase [Parvularcula sp.]|nr:protein-L-isoaspartate O-methyltransferase [Parvularcula sp.]